MSINNIFSGGLLDFVSSAQRDSFRTAGRQRGKTGLRSPHVVNLGAASEGK